MSAKKKQKVTSSRRPRDGLDLIPHDVVVSVLLPFHEICLEISYRAGTFVFRHRGDASYRDAIKPARFLFGRFLNDLLRTPWFIFRSLSLKPLFKRPETPPGGSSLSGLCFPAHQIMSLQLFWPLRIVPREMVNLEYLHLTVPWPLRTPDYVSVFEPWLQRRFQRLKSLTLDTPYLYHPRVSHSTDIDKLPAIVSRPSTLSTTLGCVKPWFSHSPESLEFAESLRRISLRPRRGFSQAVEAPGFPPEMIAATLTRLVDVTFALKNHQVPFLRRLLDMNPALQSLDLRLDSVTAAAINFSPSARLRVIALKGGFDVQGLPPFLQELSLGCVDDHRSLSGGHLRVPLPSSVRVFSWHCAWFCVDNALESCRLCRLTLTSESSDFDLPDGVNPIAPPRLVDDLTEIFISSYSECLSATPSVRFPAVRHLHVEGSDSAWAELLGAHEFPALQELTWTNSYGPGFGFSEPTIQILNLVSPRMFHVPSINRSLPDLRVLRVSAPALVLGHDGDEALKWPTGLREFVDALVLKKKCPIPSLREFSIEDGTLWTPENGFSKFNLEWVETGTR